VTFLASVLPLVGIFGLGLLGGKALAMDGMDGQALIETL